MSEGKVLLGDLDTIREEMSNPVRFDWEEEMANSHLMSYMAYMKKWGLNCNDTELATAIHSLQMFVIQHMLQRLGAPNFSKWFDNVETTEGDNGSL